MGTKPHKLNAVVVGLAVDQDEVGPDGRFPYFGRTAFQADLLTGRRSDNCPLAVLTGVVPVSSPPQNRASRAFFFAI
jgi:hypothetical protein